MATYEGDRGGLTRGGARWTGVTCATSGVSGSDVLPMHEHTTGLVIASSTQTATSLTLYSITGSSTGAAYALYDEDAVASTLTIAASRATALPTAAAPCDYIAFTSDAAASLTVVFKS